MREGRLKITQFMYVCGVGRERQQMARTEMHVCKWHCLSTLRVMTMTRVKEHQA